MKILLPMSIGALIWFVLFGLAFSSPSEGWLWSTYAIVVTMAGMAAHWLARTRRLDPGVVAGALSFPTAFIHSLSAFSIWQGGQGFEYGYAIQAILLFVATSIGAHTSRMRNNGAQDSASRAA